MARGKKIQSLHANGNGNGAEPQPEPESEQLEMFQPEDFLRFYRDYQDKLSDKREIEADIRELNKDADAKGMRRRAREFVIKLKAQVDADKLTPAEALETIEQARIFGDLLFGEPAGRDAQRSAAIEATQPLA